MSAPQTNLNKQKRRHRGPLIGMIVVVVGVLLGYLWWVGYEVSESDPPQGSETQIDGRTGEQVPPSDPAQPLDPAQTVEPQPTY